MTKHTKYHIHALYRSHLSKYVFVIFMQITGGKTQILGSLTNLHGSEPIFIEGQNNVGFIYDTDRFQRIK